MRKNIALAAALVLSLSAGAQNINPTVQVTNTYEGKLMEVHKQELEMNVPDSLLSFDWQFDYSVFDQPYKGAYDFNPYLISMKPEANPSTLHSLHINAGAGYSLHPEAQVIWSPKFSDKLALSVYDNFKGYWGDYALMHPGLDGVFTEYSAEKGHDVSNRVGLATRFTLPKIIFNLDAGYDLLRANHPHMTNNADAGDVKLGLHSQQTRKWSYGASASYRRFAVTNENTNPMVSPHSTGDIQENLWTMDAEAYRHLGSHVTFGLSGGFQWVGSGSSSVSLLTVDPQFRLEGGRLNLRTGLLFSVPWRDGCTSRAFRGNVCYPQIYADWLLVPDALKVYFNLTGGEQIGSYSSLVKDNHFAYPWPEDDVYNRSSLRSFLYDSTKKSFDVSGGVKGRFGARVQYQASVGAYRYRNALTEYINPYPIVPEGVNSIVAFGVPLLGYVRADMTISYFDVQASWISAPFTAEAACRYQSATRLSDNSFLIPAHFTGHMDFTYNWNGRIYLGAGARFASERAQRLLDGTLHLPGYWDLSANAEFRVSHNLSVWARGSNLLGQLVYDNPLYVQKGAYFTLGLTLDL